MRHQSTKIFELGVLYSRNGQNEKALLHFEKALIARKFRLGPGHIEVLAVHRRISDVLVNLRRFRDSAHHLRLSRGINIPYSTKAQTTSDFDGNTLKVDSARSKESVVKNQQLEIFDDSRIRHESNINERPDNGLTQSYIDLFKG